MSRNAEKTLLGPVWRNEPSERGIEDEQEVEVIRRCDLACKFVFMMIVYYCARHPSLVLYMFVLCTWHKSPKYCQAPLRVLVLQLLASCS